MNSKQTVQPSSSKLKKPASVRSNLCLNAAPTENAYYEEEEQEQYMIYYLLGRIYLRPVAYVTGLSPSCSMKQSRTRCAAAAARIEVVPFDPANESMAHDHDLVTETGVAPANSRPLAINLSGENAQLAVYGELGSGYLFEAPSTFQLSGQLHIAYWTEEGLAEEALKVPGAVVEVAQGTARLYICDLKHFQYTVGYWPVESTQAQVNQAADVLSHIAGSAKPGPTTGGGPRLGRAGKGVRNTGGKKITTTSAAEGSQTLHKAISALGTAKSRSEAVLSTIIAQHITLSNKSSSTSTEAAITASLTNENDVLENSGEAAAVAGSPVLKE
ncbi:hypothetical protein TYRP_009203 [Tyrophagus putrescentiae]|nr:hypothetical protein TYRP_009203 [Tyrophagus putrescentiae]